MNRLFDALDGAADGAFVIDDELRVIYWNKAAENILGFTDEDVTGKFCYQLLQGRNEEQNMICKAQCRVAKLALHSKPVPNYDIHMKTKGGDICWLNMSVFTYPMDGVNDKKMILHLFHDLDHKKIDDMTLDKLIKVISRYHDIQHRNGNELDSYRNMLTSRELEILALLADGHGTSDIAERLYLSTNTVRNHIQHVLQKLQVHTRLEAVAIAIKHNLVD
ncbi:MAG TPA: LuxR C-terminal-related transcriptional regulator [Anaerolineales bacterium]|nr:LuxR C-terminal-related transcriptional regulator [Anaerolineales bacterium]